MTSQALRVNKKRTKNTKLDETAIAVVKVNPDGWYVDNIIHGRWELNETATKIFRPLETTDPSALVLKEGLPNKL